MHKAPEDESPGNSTDTTADKFVEYWLMYKGVPGHVFICAMQAGFRLRILATSKSDILALMSKVKSMLLAVKS